jgi:hypothetical protein
MTGGMASRVASSGDQGKNEHPFNWAQNWNRPSMDALSPTI